VPRLREIVTAALLALGDGGALARNEAATRSMIEP